MLHQHKDICAPHPPHLLKTFAPLLNRYGSLQDDSSFFRLIGDMIKWVKLNPVPWDSFGATPSAIAGLCSSRSLIQIFKGIYDWEAQSKGKSIWICKSMANYDFVNEFESDGLIDKYIFLYRDGRDVALSFKNAIVGPKSAYFCAQQWAKDQLACIELANRLGTKVITVCYEELIASPLLVLSRLFSRLDLEMPDNVLDFPRSEESIHTAEAGEMWKNVARPVIPTNKRKYLTEMTEQERLIYESVAGEALSQLGYPTEHWPGKTAQDFSSEQIETFKNEEAFLKKQALETVPQHDIELRRAQEEFRRTLLQMPAFSDYK